MTKKKWSDQFKEYEQHQVDGMYHREDGGPAITLFNGSQYWYYAGMVHREDGPAIIRHRANVEKYEWYLNNKQIHSYDEFQKELGCSDSFIIYLKMKYGKFRPHLSDPDAWKA